MHNPEQSNPIHSANLGKTTETFPIFGGDSQTFSTNNTVPKLNNHQITVTMPTRFSKTRKQYVSIIIINYQDSIHHIPSMYRSFAHSHPVQPLSCRFNSVSVFARKNGGHKQEEQDNTKEKINLVTRDACLYLFYQLVGKQIYEPTTTEIGQNEPTMTSWTNEQ